MDSIIAKAAAGATGALSVAVLTWIIKIITDWRAEHRRRQRVMVALHAEISNKRELAERSFSMFDVGALCRKMEEDNEFVPHLTIENYSVPVFDIVGVDLPLLPPDVVKSVVDFYRWDRATHTAFEDLGSQGFAALSVDRRGTGLRLVSEMLESYVEKGGEALAVLERRIAESNRGVLSSLCRR